MSQTYEQLIDFEMANIEILTYTEMYSRLRNSEQNNRALQKQINYLEDCLYAATEGVVPEGADVRQQIYAVKYNQLKNGLQFIKGKHDAD